MILLTQDALDPARLIESVESNSAGAVVTFIGTVRRKGREDRNVIAMEYQAYEAMAQQLLKEIRDEALGRWRLLGCAIAHRIGRLGLGEASVLIAVSSAHRAEAFEACRFVIEQIKNLAPIWKKEIFEDGRSDWVEPPASGSDASTH